MNFSAHYEITAATLLVIRSLTDHRRIPRRRLRLARVDFRQLVQISTSAALVLTAELSKWDDVIRRNLRPEVGHWNERILSQFRELGFFDLFSMSPEALRSRVESNISSLRLVKYVKGRCGESEKARQLRAGIASLVGEEVGKWTFLRGGLDEAITNVTHHAYPEGHGFTEGDRVWYLTGSFNTDERQIKIVFYDQGIGIPASLPASTVWESVLTFLKPLPLVDQRRDATMIKAAVEMHRTSTGESDRGKGLQDLLEFVRQRGDGYLSIFSARGLYKYSMEGGKEAIKTEHFKNPIVGTLIIWSAYLASGKT